MYLFQDTLSCVHGTSKRGVRATSESNGIVICSSTRNAHSIASARLETPTTRRRIMNRLILPFITASALIFGVILPSEEAAAQTTAKDIVGTWTLVSITLEKDGKKIDFYGPN